MASSSISPKANDRSVEALFLQYLKASGSAETMLARRICLELGERIAARKAELASRRVRPVPSVKREDAYAAH